MATKNQLLDYKDSHLFIYCVYFNYLFFITLEREEVSVEDAYTIFLSWCQYAKGIMSVCRGYGDIILKMFNF